MQTFLPFPDFKASAQVLDRQRLGKQRLEAWNLLDCLRGLGAIGWRHHPAIKMWRGYEQALATYGLIVCEEWVARGYRDSMGERFRNFLSTSEGLPLVMPPWLGDPAFHASHRSNLLRKDPVHYGRYGWTEGPEQAYVWPVGDRPTQHLSR